MGILTFIVGVVILIFVLNLRDRVSKLEQQIKNGHAIQSVPLQSTPAPQLQNPQAEEQVLNHTPAAAPIVPAAPAPESSDKFVEWLKVDWLLKLGALLLLIGFGLLATYAFLNNWIGPIGRITIGIVAGALLMVLGWWRIKKYLHQGGIFLALGSTTVLLTVFAARELYGFFTPLSALGVMFLSTAFVAFASVKYNSRPLALGSLILAGIAPLLTNAEAVSYTGLFAYLFIVVLGTIWVVALTGRRELTLAALIMITCYSLPHFFLHGPETDTLLLFAYAFVALFFLTNTAGILKLKANEIIPDLLTAAGNGLFLLAWIMTAAQDEWKSLIMAAWMIVFAVGAFLIFKITKRREPFYVYASVGIAMLAAATAVELKGATLIIAYTIESGFISLITYLALKDIKVAERISLLLLAPVMLSLQSVMSPAWATGVLHKDFFVLLVVGLTLFCLGLFFRKMVRESVDAEPHQLNATLLIVGSIYFYGLLWLSLHAALQNDNIAVMISLVVYLLIGLVTYFYGLVNEKRALKLYGGTLIGFVVGRLLLIDIWRMELTGRIITFFLIGALLMSTAFLGKKKQP